MSQPFMQFYVSDYLGDTQHLSTQQHGAYLLLLFAMWKTPDGRLPNDDRKLARITRLSLQRWVQIRCDILPLCHVTEEWISQGRLFREFKKAEAKRESRQRAGKQGGIAKALKNNKQGLANGVANGVAKLYHSPEPDSELESRTLNLGLTESLFTESESSINNRPNPNSKTANRAARPSGSLDGFDAWYSTYPKHVGRGQAERSFKTARRIATLEILIAGAKKYAARSVGKNREYLKHPATWLNGKCWLDEAPETSDDGWTKVEAKLHGFRDAAQHLRNLRLHYGDEPYKALERVDEALKVGRGQTPDGWLHKWLWDFGRADAGISVGAFD